MATPASVNVTSLVEGGLNVVVFVPTDDGGARFEITVERSDGDWAVNIPWPEDVRVSAVARGHEVTGLVDGYEFTDGYCNLASPEDLGAPNA